MADASVALPGLSAAMVGLSVRDSLASLLDTIVIVAATGSEAAHWPVAESAAKIFSSLATGLAALGGAFAFLKWRHERADRTTEVLLTLERRFQQKDVQAGARLIDDDFEYERFAPSLRRAREVGMRLTLEIKALDSLLRFYVLLRGVLLARQVSPVAARACFRYYLSLYYKPGRDEFRSYVDAYFPTLRTWLEGDRNISGNLFSPPRFFDPEEFGWKATNSLPNRHALGEIPEGVAHRLKGRVLIVTGAGMSAESGVRTYRGPGGLWTEIPFEEMATLRAFTANREGIWEWYQSRRNGVMAARPHVGHLAVTEIFRGSKSCLVVTQNVDDLHERGGLESSQVVHVHGKLLDSRCMECGIVCRGQAGDAQRPCPSCGESALRPDVVWFDEGLPKAAIESVDQFLDRGPCDLVIVVGTTASFPYVLDWVKRGAGDQGVILDINPDKSALKRQWGSRVVHVHSNASAALEVLARMGR